MRSSDAPINLLTCFSPSGGEGTGLEGARGKWYWLKKGVFS